MPDESLEKCRARIPVEIVFSIRKAYEVVIVSFEEFNDANGLACDGLGRCE